MDLRLGLMLAQCSIVLCLDEQQWISALDAPTYRPIISPERSLIK